MELGTIYFESVKDSFKPPSTQSDTLKIFWKISLLSRASSLFSIGKRLDNFHFDADYC